MSTLTSTPMLCCSSLALSGPYNQCTSTVCPSLLEGSSRFGSGLPLHIPQITVLSHFISNISTPPELSTYSRLGTGSVSCIPEQLLSIDLTPFQIFPASRLNYPHICSSSSSCLYIRNSEQRKFTCQDSMSRNNKSMERSSQ